VHVRTIRSVNAKHCIITRVQYAHAKRVAHVFKPVMLQITVRIPIHFVSWTVDVVISRCVTLPIYIARTHAHLHNLCIRLRRPHTQLNQLPFLRLAVRSALPNSNLNNDRRQKSIEFRVSLSPILSIKIWSPIRAVSPLFDVEKHQWWDIEYAFICISQRSMSKRFSLLNLVS
jgi:hypothetical protein